MSAGAYFSGLVTLCAGFSMLTRLIPESSGGGGDSLRKSLYRAVSLALILCLLTPAAPLVKKLGDIALDAPYSAGYLPSEEGETDLSAVYSALARVSGEEIEKRVADELSRKFGIAEDKIRVKAFVDADGDGVRLTYAEVTLYGSAILTDPHAVIEYAEEFAGCPVEVFCSAGAPE